MSPSIPSHSSRRQPALAVVVAAAVMVLAAMVAPTRVHAHVVYDDAGDTAPDIGLIGDSSLAGVRWSEDYGALRQFNFVFNAESCRRTVETSCWSREGYRPDNVVLTMQQLAGQWGDVLVVMSGYNDSSYLFDDAVDAVVEEARRQDIPQVVWLTLRTADVSYEEPLHQADGHTYGDSNHVLFDKAAELDGYLQIADWATYSADRSEWVTDDGVHLTTEGVDGVTSFIADSVNAVLEGETITPAGPPWETLAAGDSGDRVAEVQQALLDAGMSGIGDVDGVFGDVTTEVVREFQHEQGLDESGVVDIPTAVSLDLYEEPSFDAGGGSAESERGVVPPRVDPLPVERGLDQENERAVASRSAASLDQPDQPVSSSASWLDARTTAALSVGGVIAAMLIVRRRWRSRGRDGEASHLVADSSTDDQTLDDQTLEMTTSDDLALEIELRNLTDPPYDYESERKLTQTHGPPVTSDQPSMPARGVTSPDS